VSNPSKPAVQDGRQPLAAASKLARLAAIGAAVAAVVAAFLYLGGWFTPGDLTPARFVDAFEQVDGIHSVFRRNHAKGVCVSGFFESNGQGVDLSRALVFSAGRVPVIGRFSLGGGHFDQTDAPGQVRGLGLQFSLADGEVWRTAMVNLPVFIVKTPEAFYERLLASRPDPKTGKPDPAGMEAFLAHHPETAAAVKIIKSEPPSSGFANSTFHGLNAFRFINAAGVSTPVRWLFVPDQQAESADNTAPADHAAPADKNYLFDALIAQMHRGPLAWHLTLVVGEPGDPTADATLPWPEERRQVDVGTLTLDQVESDDTSPARGLNFDPLVLPDGIEPSDDPLLSARSAVYSQDFTRRAGEPMQPAVVTPAEASRGERKEE
jgi:catalase